MTIDEVIKCEKEKSEHAKEEYLMLQDDNWTDIETYEKRLNNCANFAEYHEQLAKWLECLNEIAHIFLEHREFGEYPSSADDMWEETIRVLDKYKIEIKEQKKMIRAYDDNGNVARCVECKFYNRKALFCENDKNCYRGSGNEYAFSLDFIGIEEKLLTAEECDNWFCADFELKDSK